MPRLFLAVPLPSMSVRAALRQLMHCAASEASESPGTRLQGIGCFCTTGDIEELWSHHRALLLKFQGLGHPWQAAPLGTKLGSRDLASSQIGTSGTELWSGFHSMHLAQVDKTVLDEGSIFAAELGQARS